MDTNGWWVTWMSNKFKVFITTKPEFGVYTILTTYHFLHDSLSENKPTDEGHSIFAITVKEPLATVTKSYL